MKKTTLPRRALTLWRLRAAIVAFLVSFLLTLLLSDLYLWYQLAMILTGIAFLFFFCVYYPLKQVKFTYFLHNGQLILDCGVFYNRRRVVPLDNIQYITTLRTPDMLPFGLASLMVHSVGASLYLPCLPWADAQNLQEYCVRRKKHE
ncbi:MAG: PH domain-containing protein [Oscillospiraceae bacterium]|nr:PH domain-containing protein [Oscillospiraceae bacterium]